MLRLNSISLFFLSGNSWIYFLISSITLIKLPHAAPVKDKAMQSKRYLFLFSMKPYKDEMPRIAII
jgi:hypothetical protein